jgi:hypothetical protein
MAENRFSKTNLYKDEPKDQPPKDKSKPGGATQQRSSGSRSGGSRRAPEPPPVDMKMQKLEDLQRAYRDIRAAGRGSDWTDPFDLAVPARAEKTEEFRESFGDRPLPRRFFFHDSNLPTQRRFLEDVKNVGERVDPTKGTAANPDLPAYRNLETIPLAKLGRMDFADTSGRKSSFVDYVEHELGTSLTVDGLGRYIDAQKARKNLVVEKREETARKRRSAGPYDDPGLQDTYPVREGLGSRTGPTAVDADIKERNRIDKNIKMATDVRKRLMKVRDLTAATPTAKK